MLSALDIRALIVVGGEDAFTPIEDAQLMHELIQDSVLS
jgi:hypothetical protein